MSTLSLVVWIYALGQGPFRFMRAPWWEPWYGSVLLALWTLVPPMFLTRAEPATGAAGRAEDPHAETLTGYRAHASAAGLPAERPHHAVHGPARARTAGRRG